jgi:hypothetical protein
MDTRAVADQLGTDPKTLRRFLRSSASSVTPVGSGGRYAFTNDQLPTMRREFDGWTASQADKPVAVTSSRKTSPKTKRTQADRDAEVWAEEGDVVMPDIRIPAVRRAVRMAAAARVERLEALLRERGLHISQSRDRVPA